MDTEKSERLKQIVNSTDDLQELYQQIAPQMGQLEPRYYNKSDNEIIKDYADSKRNVIFTAADEDIDLAKDWVVTPSQPHNNNNNEDNTLEFVGLLQTQNEALKSENERLKSERSSIANDNSKLQHQYEMKTLEYEKLKENYQQLKQNYDFEKLLFDQTQKKYHKNETELNEVSSKALEWAEKYQTQNKTYQQLQKRHEKQNQLLKTYKQQNNILQQQFVECQQNTHIHCQQLIQSHADNAEHFKHKYNDLTQKYNALDAKFEHNNDKFDRFMKQFNHKQCISKIEQLQNDLAHAQRSILEMTNVVGVKQLLPTVQETLSQFHSIRDQQHHNTSTQLKKYIINIKQNKWQKYYINQIVHQILFNIVIKSYDTVTQFKQNMFNVIANELNMRYTLTYSNANANDMDDSKNDEHINHEIDRILSNRFGSYFKDNYKTVLKIDEIAEKVLRDILSEEYSECLINIEPGNTLNSLNAFVIQCCHICWIMILQNPYLHLQPTIWKPKQTIEFNEKMHKRVLGSDRKCKTILYYVWPVIARNNSILEDQKMDVLLRDNMYLPYKQQN